MEKRFRITVVVIMVMALLTNPVLLAAGNPIPGRWEKVIDTKAGAGITVYTKDGTGQECKLQSVDDEFLICTDRNKKIIQIEKVSIDKVILDSTGRNIKKGALWGTVGGVAAGGIMTSQFNREAGMYLLPLGAAIGCAAGMALFAAKEPDETIYLSKEAAQAEVK